MSAATLIENRSSQLSRSCGRLWAGAGLATVLWGSAVVTQAADVIVRRSDQSKVAGSITSMNRNQVTVKPVAGDSVTVPTSDIASIEWDDAPASFRVAVGDENGGRLQRALDGYQKLKADNKLPTDNLKVEANYLIARTLARMALVDQSKRDTAVKEIEAVLKATPEHIRYYELAELLGRVYLAKQDFTNASRVFEGLASAPSNDHKFSSKIALARVALAEDKIDDAVKLLDEVVQSAGNDPVEQSRKFEALTAKSRALMARSQYELAVTSLTEVSEKASPEDGSLQAETYLLLGNCYQALNRPKEAILAYLHVDLLFPRESAFHAESLYHLTRLWKLVQQEDRSFEARSKLEGQYAESDWARRLTAATPE